MDIIAISRMAGERTKVAVSSKDEKIDCVGACVGVRGSRIKNIVFELHGEKVDIVRWHEEIKQYVKAAISPAKVTKIELNLEDHKMDVEVDDDQLSLAIGKKGQNVRLASKLIGWSINIMSASQVNKETDKEEIIIKESVLGTITGIGKKTLEALIEAGFDDLKVLSNAQVSDLTAVRGVGKKRAEQILEEIKKLEK